MRTAITLDMNTMPVAPEKLLMMFSLTQVAEMVIAHEDVTVYGREPAEDHGAIGEDTVTVRPQAA